MAKVSRLILSILLCVAAPAAATAGPTAVVELFTSQGCSSCRSADAYLAELVKRDDLVVLSYHVDYWDFLGWRDTLARPENAERQRAYAEALGSRRMYTPQMLVNGTDDLVGSDRRSVEAAIAAPRLSVPVSIRRENGTVAIEIGAGALPGSRPTTIRLVPFASIATVQIGRGENAGATIGYHNVVLGERPIGMWNGAVVKITLPEDEIMADGVDGCAVLVQEDLAKGPGAIVGAAEISIRTP